MLKLTRAASSNHYGEGFWSDRFKFLDYTGSRFIESQEKSLVEQLSSLGSMPQPEGVKSKIEQLKSKTH